VVQDEAPFGEAEIPEDDVKRRKPGENRYLVTAIKMPNTIDSVVTDNRKHSNLKLAFKFLHCV